MAEKWQETTTQLKERTTDLLHGELTLNKFDFCLIGLICLFAGICIGLLTAPLTRGISINIGSNNGSNNTGNGCHNGSENGNHENNGGCDEN